MSRGAVKVGRDVIVNGTAYLGWEIIWKIL